MALILLIIYITFIGLGLPDALLGSAWTVMQGDISAPPELAGAVSLLVSLCTVISSLSAGRFLYRYGTGRVALVSVLLTAVALTGYAVTKNFWTLLLSAIPMGLGAGAVDAALSNFVALHLEARHLSWQHSFWGIGAVSGPLLMSFFLDRGNLWRQGFTSVAVILAGIVLILTVSLPIWRRYETPGVHADKKEKPISNREAFRIRGVRSSMLALLCYNGSETAAGLWMASYFVSRDMTPETAAACCSLFYIGIITGRIAAGFLSIRVTPRRIVRWGGITACIGVTVMLLPLSPIVSIAGLLLMGLGGAPVFPMLIHSAPDNFGKHASSGVIGLEMASCYVGSTLIPFLMGAVAAQIGMSAIPPLFLLLFGTMLASTEFAAHTLARGTAEYERKKLP